MQLDFHFYSLIDSSPSVEVREDLVGQAVKHVRSCFMHKPIVQVLPSGRSRTIHRSKSRSMGAENTEVPRPMTVTNHRSCQDHCAFNDDPYVNHRVAGKFTDFTADS